MLEYSGAFLQLYRLEGWDLALTMHCVARVSLDHFRRRILEDAPGRQALWAELQTEARQWLPMKAEPADLCLNRAP